MKFTFIVLIGKVVDNSITEEEEEEMAEEEEEPSESSEHLDKDSAETETPDEISKADEPVATQETSSGEIIVEQSVMSDLRPDLSEIRKENNKDTMSYLKSKRINRHKNNDMTDAKKFKTSN